jgi:flagellin
MAMNAYRNYNNNTSALSSNLEKLSSGYKINRAGDDAAGLAISEKMRAQISGLDQAQSNVKDGISLVKTGEGALQEVQDMLNRMVTLATQSANGTYDDSVDRDNLQKEVDSLKSEINRIADSANFNGINLLDGTLGLNTDAFSFKDLAATEASVEAIKTLALAASVSPADATYHLGTKNVVEAKPSFSIELGDAVYKNSATNAKATLSLVVAGVTVKVEVSSSATLDLTASTGVAKVVAALKNESLGTGAGVYFKAQGLLFSVSAAGNKINFTYAGHPTASNAALDASTAITSTEAQNINGQVGSSINTTVSTSLKLQSGMINHNTVDTVDAVAAKAGKRAGIDLDISNLVKAGDGTELTIDGKTFVIKTKTSSSYTGNVIDVSKATTSTARISQAVVALSGYTTDNFIIEDKGDNKTIHVEQQVGNDKEYSTDKDLRAVFSAQKVSEAAKGAGKEIVKGKGDIAEGNTIKVDDTSYVFTKDTKAADTSTTKYVLIGSTGTASMTNLMNAINNNTKSEYTATMSGDNVDVRAKDATGDAPEISGKGLTLQIGDTSDDFNQLAVTISDMHTDTMGIKDIDISTQEGASTAIDKIKNAINFVSSTRGTLGATQNRLEHTQNNLSVMTENIQDAESTIRDTDIAEEMMSYTKNNILVQSAQAMLAQANSVPQGVLQLLQ